MGEPIPTGLPSTSWEPTTGTPGAKDVFAVRPEHGSCPGCGAPLELYEIFACRIRGLTRPVCIGCLAQVLVDMRDLWRPLIVDLEQKILELAEKIPYERGEHHG